MAPASPAVEAIEERIRAGSKRVTAAKRTVAEVLVGAADHVTVDEITLAVQRRRPDVSPSTVYRILEEFEDLGIVVHAHLGQPAAVYHLATTRHAHLTCQECHATVEIPASDLDALSARLRARYGFTLDRHHVALSGVCSGCAPSPALDEHPRR